MASKSSTWQGRPVLDGGHVPELEQRSASLEFKHGLARQQAEAQAYREYRREHHLKAAAHHLLGMKASSGSGDTEEGRKHGAMYQLHMEKLGLDPWKEPDEELRPHLKADEKQPLHRFRAHKGDQFVVDAHRQHPVEKSLHRLWAKGAEILSLQKAEPHSSVEGFMTGLKALPRGTPERGRFITQHMGHAPFLQALQAHPQGKQVHQLLTQHLNSRQNAGFQAGTTQVMAKGDVLKFPGNPSPPKDLGAPASVQPLVGARPPAERKPPRRSPNVPKKKEKTEPASTLDSPEGHDYTHFLQQHGVAADGHTLTIHRRREQNGPTHYEARLWNPDPEDHKDYGATGTYSVWPNGESNYYGFGDAWSLPGSEEEDWDRFEPAVHAALRHAIGFRDDDKR